MTGAAPASPAPPWPLVRDGGLLVVLVILANGLLWPGAADVADLAGTFHLALCAHAMLAIHDGRFGPWHARLWPLLLAVAAADIGATFLGFALPGPDDAGERDRIPALWPALMLAILTADILAMHAAEWRQRSWRAMIIGLVVLGVGTVAVGLILSPFAPTPPDPSPGDANSLFTPSDLLPPWQALPAYAILRAVPDKLGGVAVMMAALLLPAIWPWVAAWRFRLGPARLLWPVLCVLLAAVWLGLALLGARPPEDAVIAASRLLAGYHLAFFLLLPFLLRRFLLRRSSRAER